MAASPRWKVYTADGKYIASCKEVMYAGFVLGGLGEEKGATIRDGHSRVVWTEGQDGWANESYDVVLTTVEGRILTHSRIRITA